MPHFRSGVVVFAVLSRFYLHVVIGEEGVGKPDELSYHDVIYRLSSRKHSISEQNQRRSCSITEFGASPDRPDNAPYIQQALLECDEVMIPSGERGHAWYTSSLLVRDLSNRTLVFEQPKVSKDGTPDQTWPAQLIFVAPIGFDDVQNLNQWYPVEHEPGIPKTYRSLIYLENVTNFKMVGPGLLNATAVSRVFWRLLNLPPDLDDHPDLLNATARPSVLRVRNSVGVVVDGLDSDRGLRFLDSPVWTMQVIGSRQVTIKNLRMDVNVSVYCFDRSSPWVMDATTSKDCCFQGANQDGIDIANSEDVLVEKCTINSHDDSVMVGAGAGWNGGEDSLVTRNVTVRDSAFYSGEAGVVFDTVWNGDASGRKQSLIHDVLVENVSIGLANHGSNHNGSIILPPQRWSRGIQFRGSQATGSVIRDVQVKNISVGSVHLALDLLSGPELVSQWSWRKSFKPLRWANNITLQDIKVHEVFDTAAIEYIAVPGAVFGDGSDSGSGFIVRNLEVERLGKETGVMSLLFAGGGRGGPELGLGVQFSDVVMRNYDGDKTFKLDGSAYDVAIRCFGIRIPTTAANHSDAGPAIFVGPHFRLTERNDHVLNSCEHGGRTSENSEKAIGNVVLLDSPSENRELKTLWRLNGQEAVAVGYSPRGTAVDTHLVWNVLNFTSREHCKTVYLNATAMVSLSTFFNTVGANATPIVSDSGNNHQKLPSAHPVSVLDMRGHLVFVKDNADNEPCGLYSEAKFKLKIGIHLPGGNWYWLFGGGPGAPEPQLIDKKSKFEKITLSTTDPESQIIPLVQNRGFNDIVVGAKSDRASAWISDEYLWLQFPEETLLTSDFSLQIGFLSGISAKVRSDDSVGDAEQVLV